MSNSIMFSNALLQGARNCAVNCGGVKAGDNVLILSLVNDPVYPVDDLAVQALATACQEVGARPQVMWATGMEKGWWDTPSPIILGAFEKADLVINNTLAIGRPIRAVREIMFRQGVPMIRNMATTATALASAWARFPFALSDEITSTAGQYVDNATRWRVVAPNGTDISGNMAPPSQTQSGFAKYATHRGTSKNRPFPQGCIVPITSTGANGVIVTDRTLPIEARHLGVSETGFRDEVRITVENNMMVNIEGGKEAVALRRFFERMSKEIGDNAWNLSSFHSGINPKAGLRVSPDLHPDLWNLAKHNHPSSMHFHCGGNKQVVDFDYPYMFHVSLEVDDATMYMDDTALYTDGTLNVLSENHIVELASRFGDAEDILRSSSDLTSVYG